MESSTDSQKNNFIIDSIHGDIQLSDKLVQVIDTPSFQRLRRIKQLQMSHLTYPNATHTRFMHSLGVLGIMLRVIDLAKNKMRLSEVEVENLQLAALLHDIGHYPYSHLMEKIEKVILIEDVINDQADSDQTKTLKIPSEPYPEHEILGVKILTSQQDIIEAIGGLQQAQEVADLFSGNANDSQLTKLITSSLDLDRFDYLQRDAIFTGLPYGKIDLTYLLNSLQMNAKGEIGVCDRAIPAVEHYLLARYFMHRVVYFHRTTVAFEEACRQLLKRLRNTDQYDIPKDGSEIVSIFSSDFLFSFTDAFVDNLIQKATKDTDEIIKSLALSIQSRNAPKLLKEVFVLDEERNQHHAGTIFKMNFKSKLSAITRQYSIPPGLFLFYESKINLEKPEDRYTFQEVESMSLDEKDEAQKREKEVVQIFTPDNEEPKPIFEIDHSIIRKLKDLVFRIYRLYIVPSTITPKHTIDRIKRDVLDWDKP